MKKKYQILGFVLLVICSVIYDFQKPEKQLNIQKSASSYVILEGAFLKQGKYEFEGEKTIKNVIDEVGVLSNANLDALSKDRLLKDESVIYLPVYNNKCVSLNNATKEELMTLERVGEKTAQKIIDYRKKQPFTCIEDIMNVSGIGEKSYQRIRDYLCL